MKKFFALILAIIISLFSLNGCSTNNSFVTTLELDNKVSTIDPQLASMVEDKMLVRNLYEGLLRENKDGQIVCGVAKNYTVSAEGLTYTFTLRDDASWNDGSKLTANDFEFAFKRALDPGSKAPYSHLLNNVLSYKAKGDYTFEIILKQPDADFINTICKPICMPCNEAFFYQAKGKYGLDSSAILSNGSFEIKKWNKDGEYTIKLVKNANYKGDFSPTASTINISLGSMNERSTRMEKEYIEFGFVDYTNANKTAEKVTYLSNYDTTYILLINKKGLLQSNEMRLGIEKSIDRNKINTTLPGCFTSATAILPPSVKVNNETLSDKFKIYYNNFNANAAGEHYRAALKEYKNYNLSGLNIAYYKDENVKTLASTIAETWQQTINGYVNIKEYESKSELNNDIYNNKFDFAIIPYIINDSNILEFLERLKIDNPNYLTAINSLKSADANTEKINAIKNALTIIYNEKTAIPLIYSATVFGVSNKYNIPNINPENGYIDFALLTQK